MGCEWQTCYRENVLAMSNPPKKIKSSRFDWPSKNSQLLKSSNDEDKYALKNAICCNKLGSTHADICFLADAEESGRMVAKLPKECSSTNLFPCHCKLDPVRHFYCDNIEQEAAIPCKNLQLGQKITCTRNKQTIAVTNSISPKVPTGCSLLQ